MNSIQESTNELNAAIRYAENAITSAKQTIESMQFRQDMAKKQYTEQTGREQALECELEQRISEVADLKVQIADMMNDLVGDAATIKQLREELEQTKSLEEQLKGQVLTPTMPVIPKDVAIAIFREGVAYGVSKACDELDNSADIEISETGYTGDFEVSFTKYIELSDHIDLDWLRSEVGVNDEADVIEALKNLCADNKFECRIHGVDDQEEKKND